MPTPEDFSALMDMDAEKALKPPPLPKGTYRAVVKENQERTANTGTSGIEFTFTDLEPLPDVDSDAWMEYVNHPAINKDSITLTETFWLSSKSMYRLRNFCEACGAEPVGKMSKMVADSMNQHVLLSVVQSVSRQSGAVFNEVNGYAKDE